MLTTCSPKSVFVTNSQYICNNATGRYIKIGGPAHMKLIYDNLQIKNQDLSNSIRYMLSKRTFNTITPGTLTVSSYSNFFPISYHTESGIAGLDVDIMTMFAEASGLKLEFIIKENFDGIWFDPINNISDTSIGGIGISNQRTTVNTEWTLPYFNVNRTVVYNKNNPIFSFPKDVNGYILAVPASTGYIDAQIKLKTVGKDKLLVSSQNDEKNIQQLINGSVQGLIRGSFVGKAIVEKYPTILGMVTPWEIDSKLVGSDGEVFAFPCNNKSGLAVGLTAFLTYLKCVGTMDSLLEKYHLSE